MCVNKHINVYGCFAYMYVCTPYVFLVPTEVRRELELEMAMNYHVGAVIQTQVLWKNIQCP